MNRQQAIGKIGERLAVIYLEQQGFQIVKQNFRSGRGEIDIIAVRQYLLVFVEVKTRTRVYGGMPEQQLGWRQQSTILETAERYLEEHRWRFDIRFDIISVELGDATRIEHFEDAFY